MLRWTVPCVAHCLVFLYHSIMDKYRLPYILYWIWFPMVFYRKYILYIYEIYETAPLLSNSLLWELQCVALPVDYFHVNLWLDLYGVCINPNEKINCWKIHRSLVYLSRSWNFISLSPFANECHNVVCRVWVSIHVALWVILNERIHCLEKSSTWTLTFILSLMPFPATEKRRTSWNPELKWCIIYVFFLLILFWNVCESNPNSESCFIILVWPVYQMF